jgi:hypothetical protein
VPGDPTVPAVPATPGVPATPADPSSDVAAAIQSFSYDTGLEYEAPGLGEDGGDYSKLLSGGGWGGSSSYAAVPEPATVTLVGLGVLALVLRRKRQ